MSCEQHRKQYLQLMGDNPGIAAALGGDDARVEPLLESVYQTVRSQTKNKSKQTKAADAQAEAKTRLLFKEMKQANIDPPTHSTSGLPRRKAQYGYAAVYDTLVAARSGGPLPKVAQAAVTNRTITSAHTDARGMMRCQNCGQFVSAQRAHICSKTTNAAALNKHLATRLGFPDDALSTESAMDALIEQARAGDIRMQHNLTGEEVGVSLDGLPLAFAGGFEPMTWAGDPDLASVSLGDRVVSVIRPGATRVAPVDDAIMQAAQAYGHVLDFGDLKDAEAAALVGLPTGTVFDLRAGVAFLESANTSELAAALKVPHDPADALGVQDAFFARAMELHKKTPRTNVASAAALPLMQQQQVLPASQTTVAGGQEYDWGHFVGTEYRKGGSHGQTVSDGSTGYTVGDSSADPLDFSSARNWNLEPAPKNGEVVVGRTLVAAVGVLSDGRVVETADGQVEVYGVLGDLLAVYDPQTKTAGDTRGTQNASSAQMAAVIAHQVMHARNPFDAALATDLTRARSGNGSGLAAADSAYIALKNGLFANGADIQLGGQISTQKCPDCGQFMGSAHICPNQEAVGAPAADAVAAPAAMEQPQVNIEVEVDTQPIADAMGGQELTLDSDALAKALQDGLGVGQPAAAQAASGDFSGVEAALTQMAEAITQLAQNDGAGISDERLAELIASTASNMGQPVVMADAAPAAVAAPAPAAVTAPAAKKKRKKIDLDAAKAGRPLVEDLKGKKKGTLTAQERMFKDITLPAPDPFLRAVPEHVGGQLDEPLMQSIPALNTDFQINDSTRDILRAMAATLKAGQAAEEDQQGALRTFGLYGPPGGGKNTILRQLAASLIVEHPDGEKLRGIPYVEATLLPDSSIEELIGATVLVSDGEGGTESRVQLGRLGLAAAMGSVVVINEAVRSPKLMTKLQSMIEDRVIEVDSPEGGVIEIPVHPSTVFGVTWNSGLEGDADRPALAPLSRMMTFPLAPPTNDEQAMRVDAFFAGMSEDVRPTPEETMAGVLFMNDINLMTNGGIGDRKIGLNSDAPTGPGPRELNRFLLLGKTTGDWRLAAKTLAICCDQDATFKDQWSLINERFEAHFGVDGNAVNRAQAGEAPAMN